MPSLLALLRLLRPAQWSKNVFVLAPLVFAAADQRVEHRVVIEDLWRTLVAIAAFCLASSAVYVLNDVMDAERDRKHPTKCRRPIAAREVSEGFGLIFSVVLATAALVLAHSIEGSPWPVAPWLAGYLTLNLAYSWRLKRVVLLDVFCIATGFVLRVVAGGVAAHAEVSHWLFLCTFLLALFLGLNKRRAELVAQEGSASTRVALREYSVGFLDQMTGVLAACTILCYTMYTVDPSTMDKFGQGNRLVATVPFVAFGVARYMLLVQSERAGENPSKVFLGGDWLFFLNLVGWAGTAGVVLFWM